jgi:hypothetical protein
VAELVAKGMPAVKVVYEDGGTHASFREAMVASAGGGGDDGSAFAVLQARPRRNLGDVSRPEALAMGPREIEISPAAGKTEKPGKPAAALAFAGSKPAPAATTTVARAAPSTASLAASPTAGESKSLYDRVFGNLFGSSTAEPEATAGEPAAVPLPPRRGAAAKPPERRAAMAQPRVN